MKPPLFTALVLSAALGPTLFAPTSAPTQNQAVERVRLLAQASDQRLEDIQQSPDGSRLITHDRRYAPRLWDVKTMKMLRILGGHPDLVQQVFYSADGGRIVTVSAKEVRVWDSLRGRTLLTVPMTDAEPATRAAISPDNQRLAVGTTKGRVLIVKVDANTTRADVSVGQNPILELSYDSKGTRLAVCGDDVPATVLDPATGKVMMTAKEALGPMRWIEFSPDGTDLLATGKMGNEFAYVLDATTGQTRLKLPHAKGEKGDLELTLMSALYVGKEPLILTAGADGKMILHDRKTGAKMGELPGHKGQIREIRVSNDRRYVGTAGTDERIRFWSIEARAERPYMPPSDVIPTAGSFSAANDVFWMGYSDGSIRQHEVETGKVRTTTLGSVIRSTDFLVSADGSRWAARFPGGHFAWRTENPSEVEGYGLADSTATWRHDGRHGRPQLSPDGRFMLIGPYDTKDEKQLYYVQILGKRQTAVGYKNALGTQFVGDGTRTISWHQDGTVYLWDVLEKKSVKAWQFSNIVNIQKGNKEYPFFAASRDGAVVATYGHNGTELYVWDMETGKIRFNVDPEQAAPEAAAFSPDGSRVAVAGESGVEVWDVASGKRLAFENHKRTLNGEPQLAFSANGSAVVLADRVRTDVFDAATAKRKVTVENTTFEEPPIADRMVSPDGRRLVTVNGNLATITDIQSDRAVSQLVLTEAVTQAQFTPEGNQVVTIDGNEGLVFWNLKAAEPARDGSILWLTENQWLTLDASGRYDSTDPSDVRGAHYVLEWSGGLEPISVTQLKSQFYDPGLFAKITGKGKEPKREVPDLSALRLYPEIVAKSDPKDPLKISVTLKDRDEGGIGRISVYLNGKLVQTKDGTGFFEFNAGEFNQFLLPANHLPSGQGNLVQIEVTNEEGDLTSSRETLDVGVPSSLKPPEVRLYGLFAGVGDYPGTRGDLNAPPADARALANAIRIASEKLLPGRTSLTVLTTAATEPGDRPTRSRIVQWFDDVAKKATSSDIIIIYFSGHGTSKIGQQAGYFFLTPEMDPGQMSEAMIANATISGEDLRKRLSTIAANKQVVILDTCHSGAAADSLIAERSVSGDYQRAWESIKDSTGTWMLAGSAADQVSYEATTVEHGMLTYSLLEAIDRVSPQGLREAPGGDLFLDIERWLTYAANRVESLKTEVGIAGIQRPEFKRSRAGSSFDIGVLTTQQRGALGLKPPRPIVLVGEFEQDKEDPEGLEDAMRTAMRESNAVKAWFDVGKHPNAYRVAGEYAVEADAVKLKVYLQIFDVRLARRTLETFEVSAPKGQAASLASRVRTEVESRIKKREEQRAAG